MKKKVVSLCLVALLAMGTLIGGTMAYFIDSDEAKNEFTVGNVDIDLVEEQWDAVGEKEAEDVYPGEALAKDPVVKNVGKNPCFVRVKVEGLDQFGNKGMITLRHGQYEEGYDNVNWTYLDGYYYYNKPLATTATAGDQWNLGLTAETEPLFNQIVMPTGITGDETTQDIVVTAEAVQAQGAQPSWSAVKAMTVEQIAGWFTTCGF